MIYLYTEKYTPRVQYVCSHIFTTMLGKQITWIYEWDKLPNPKENTVVAYTSKDCPDGVFSVCPHGLLFKQGIKEQSISMGQWEGMKTFFETQGGHIPFDLFSAVFYLITRYEEYTASSDAFDDKGRFKATNSLAYREGFLREPLIDKWVIRFEQELQKCCSTYQPSVKRQFVFRPVIVINNLFKYQNKPILTNLNQMATKLVKGKWESLKLQLKVLLHITSDPYCNFSSLMQLHNRNNLLPIFFLKVSNSSWWNRPVYATYRSYRKLLLHNYMLELNSSLQASENIKQYLSERKKLHKITKSQVVMNCFHHLAFRIPRSYRNLLKASIKDDYSMVYADEIGFRASTCTPYKYYDLEKEDYYKLVIHPVALCDDMLRKTSCHRDQVYQNMLQMAECTRQVQGELVTIFHNDILSDAGRWSHWLGVYESAIHAIANMEVK
mgnify:CR=1 FL=1